MVMMNNEIIQGTRRLTLSSGFGIVCMVVSHGRILSLVVHGYRQCWQQKTPCHSFARPGESAHDGYPCYPQKQRARAILSMVFIVNPGETF